MFNVLLSPVIDVIWQAFASTSPLFYVLVPYWAMILVALTVSPITVLLPQFLRGQLSWPRSQDVPDEWIIDGKRYNLRPFFKFHPGGEFPLRSARGSDCTGLVESYHVFIDKETFKKMLARFEIQDAPAADPPKVMFSDPFYEDLKEAAREHFKGKPRSARKMIPSHIVLCMIAWAAMWASIYALLWRDCFWAIPFIGVLSWYLTGNVMHDASHGAFSTSPIVNRVLSHAAFPYGVNTAGWQIQHVMSHHIYTNEEDDVDLFHFDPLIVLEKRGNGKGNSISWFAHCIRLVLLFSSAVPHLGFVVPYGLLFHQIDPMHGHRMYDRIKAINAHRAELKWDFVLELAALVVFYYVCAQRHGFILAACTQMSIYTVSSYCFCFFTQVSHLQPECFPDLKELQKLPFAKRQVVSSMDFAADSFFWGHISGGLNTQALHHIFPGISAMHLRSLYPKFREVCRKHNVQLKESVSLKEFLWGFMTYSN